MDLAERCGGMEESLRMKWIIDSYSLVRDKDTNAPIKTFVKPFGADGSRKIWRAQCNQRRQRATTGKYKKSVLARGIVPGVRGDAFFTLSPENLEPFDAVTFGSLTDSFYLAAAEDPKNGYIKHIIENGIECWVLDGRMPETVKEWVKFYHNKFHCGSELTVGEALSKTVSVHNQWRVYADTRGICAHAVAGGTSYQTKDRERERERERE